MKRITKLKVSNFRGFFDSYEIELSRGENLLIYGENGSGKSSLYKSLSNFLSSSQNNAFPFIRHNCKEDETGEVTVTFQDYNQQTNSLTPGTGQAFSFGSNAVTTDTVQFLKTAELTKGFLDYRGMLAVYNHSVAQPNLFKLIIEVLLKDFIPIGGTHPMGRRFVTLKNKITNAYTRNTYDYRIGIREMEIYETLLRTVLNGIFLQLNAFLIKFFRLNLRVWYSLTTLDSLGNSWRQIPTELKLEIKQNGKPVVHQFDYLNEARLSALAICLYLSILKRNPQPIDYKILFLDDVFIGLDLSNRFPILDILKNEFSDYQIFISTYDRHLYELAKRKFETERPDRWKAIELYVGKVFIDDQPHDKPIIVDGETHLEKAIQYLHNLQKPDYPAAANYFRKALEQIIREEIPQYEKTDIENKVQILDYKLGPLIYKTKRFLERLHQNTQTVDKIITLLPSLLHPLSHYEITSPVYKGELRLIEFHIPLLLQELKSLDIPHKVKCSPLEGRNQLKIRYTIDNAAGHFSFYFLRTLEPLLLKQDNMGNVTISETKCCIESCYGMQNGHEVPHSRKNFSDQLKAHPDNNFISIKDAYNRVYNRIIIIPHIGNFPQEPNYIDAISYLDQQGVYQSLNSVIVW